jgi:ribA/ribD-fused uncharacterized protein
VNVISEFQGKWGFLSNFKPPLIFIRCEACGEAHEVTVEHAFQAAKTASVGVQHAILVAATPGQAKRMGRVVDLVPNWDQVKVNTMNNLVRMKFMGITEGRALLLSTGDNLLVEGNKWHDTFWGKCNCPIHEGRGANMLGVILMQVRSEIIAEGGNR